jgi:hypothetical protein
MPSKQPLPEYTTDQITELIKQYIHDKLDRKMLYWRLVDGDTFEAILNKIYNEDRIRTVKTVRERIHKGEEILFKHIPG